MQDLVKIDSLRDLDRLKLRKNIFLRVQVKLGYSYHQFVKIKTEENDCLLIQKECKCKQRKRSHLGEFFLCTKLDNDKIFFILCTTKESTQRNLRDNRFIFIKIFVDRCTATDIIYTRVGNLTFFLPVFLYYHSI